MILLYCLQLKEQSSFYIYNVVYLAAFPILSDQGYHKPSSAFFTRFHKTKKVNWNQFQLTLLKCNTVKPFSWFYQLFLASISNLISVVITKSWCVASSSGLNGWETSRAQPWSAQCVHFLGSGLQYPYEAATALAPFIAFFTIKRWEQCADDVFRAPCNHRDRRGALSFKHSNPKSNFLLTTEIAEAHGVLYIPQIRNQNFL
jgi:hypothetical protein